MTIPAHITTDDLLDRLHYQTAPGVHTCSTGECGHTVRGGHYWCCNCLDAELLRRGVDVTVNGSRYQYIRDGRGIMRKRKGQA